MTTAVESTPATPEISLHTFSTKHFDTTVSFHAWKLEDSFYLWIGTTPELKNMAVAMNTRYESQACGTSIMGDSTDPTSTTLAQKLAKRTGKQVFVSYNGPTDGEMLPAVERSIIEEMKAHPDKFGL